MKKNKIVIKSFLYLLVFFWFFIKSVVFSSYSTSHGEETVNYIDAMWNVFEYGTLNFSYMDSSNPENDRVITILDSNLWATDSNPNWYYFQWWNNYWFDGSEYMKIADHQSNLSEYSRDNPYTDNRFFIDKKNIYWWVWDKSNNLSLRWWESDASSDIESSDNNWWLNLDNAYHRQWPCPVWFHIPSQWEWNELLLLWASDKYELNKNSTSNLSYWYNIWFWFLFSSDFKLPFAWYIDYTTAILKYVWQKWSYWSSSPFSLSVSNQYSRRFHMEDWYIDANYYIERSYWLPIRCFKDVYKNEKSKPIIISYDTRWWKPIQSQSVSKWTDIFVPNEGIPWTWHGSESYIVWWYTDPNLNEKDKVELGSTQVDNDTVLYAKRSDDYEISFDLWDDSDMQSIYVTANNWDNNPIYWDLPVPTRDWYTFEWWYTSPDWWDRITSDTVAILTGDKTLYAKRNKVSTSIKWWIWWGRSGWWGWSIWQVTEQQKKSAQIETKTDITMDQWNEVSIWESEDFIEQNFISDEIGDEYISAYEFCYNNGITTISTIKDANITWRITRIELAKMLSYYAINVLWRVPDETINNKFNDISDILDEKYNYWVKLSYQLWIMWINMLNNEFRPFDYVTRAEFATALSRMRYLIEDWNPYYEPHLSKLMLEWVITNDNPKMEELRGYVMIMLMRSSK